MPDDPASTTKLIDAFERRVLGSLKKYAPRVLDQRADCEDAMQDVMVVLWEALPRLAEPELVGHPWAYVTTIIGNEAKRVEKRRGARASREWACGNLPPDGVDAAHEALDESDRERVGTVVRRWLATLTRSQWAAAQVVIEADRRGVSRKTVLAELYPTQQERNRVERQITRGRQPGGFIAKFQRLKVEGNP
jgi:hypothetical protein